MKKSQELSRKTWKMIAKNLIVLAVLAVAAFIGVMSWFTQNTTARADGINAKTQVDDGLEFYIMPPSDSDQYTAINTRLADNATYNADNNLSKDDAGYRRTTWHDSHDGATFDVSDQEFKFLEGLFLCEVTSDGKTFKIPKLMQYDNVAYIDVTQEFDPAVANDEYMSYDIYFRTQSTQSDHTVSLKTDSFISPNTDTVKSNGTYSDPSNSTNADIKDAAIGAVRMSMLNMQANGNREVLWIPGPYVYYDGLADKLDTGLTSDKYSNKGAVYFNVNETELATRSGEGTNTHAYYASKTTRNVIRPTDTNLEGSMIVGENPDSTNDRVLVTLNQSDGNGYYYGHVRVNIWIEGEDAEARLAFVGGKFKFSLNYEMN